MNTKPLTRVAVAAVALTIVCGPAVMFAAPRAPIVSHQKPFARFGSVERIDAALDAFLGSDAGMEKLAEGFNWSEGPVWMPKQRQLVFSDVPENLAYRWRENDGVDVFLESSGLTGEPNGAREPGSNGLTLDVQGRLLLAQHGDRRIARLNDDGCTFTTIAARFEGKRFNSPNDLCVDRRGNVFFTDPPYGTGGSVVRDMDFCGVYRASPDGAVSLLSRELERPNGIELSPDERTLYVANSDGRRPVIMAFSLSDDGSAGPGRVFFDSSSLQARGRRGAMDGFSVDELGNLWATGPGGVLIIDPQGKLLGTLMTGRATANCCFGGPEGTTLFITADDVLCRIETKVKGRGP